MARYRKGTKINSGGFGTVYRAVRVEDEEVVAFKELSGTNVGDGEKQRFVREVKIQAKLNHKNVVPILGYNLTADPPWFVMPLAKSNLRDEIEAVKGNAARAVNLFFQILAGVEHAHKNGIVHRDLKPENILFFDAPFEDEVVRIGDFGLGKRLDFESVTITRSSQNMGTAAYMPPEQFTDFKHLDHRADIFSLGKILYEMLTGVFPMHVDVRNPKVSGGYGFIISKCLEHDPSNRYAAVKELRDDFQLLTRSPEKFEEPVKAAEALLNDLLSGGGKSLQGLDELFQSNQDDEVFFTKVFPRLPRLLVEQYHAELKHRFFERLRKFDEFVSGSLPFAYTDVVADFYQEVYSIVQDLEIKRLILTRVLEMGRSHNRFHVGHVFGAILKSIKSHEEALLAREVLRQNPSAAAWCADECKGGEVLPAILEAIDECVASCSRPVPPPSF